MRYLLLHLLFAFCFLLVVNFNTFSNAKQRENYSKHKEEEAVEEYEILEIPRHLSDHYNKLSHLGDYSYEKEGFHEHHQGRDQDEHLNFWVIDPQVSLEWISLFEARPLQVQVEESAVHMRYVDKVPVVTQIHFNPCQLKLKEVVEHGDRVATTHYDHVLPHIFKILMQINLIDVDHKHE